MKRKKYLIRESKCIESFKTKKEAENHINNMSWWYPENSYEIVEQEV